MMSCFRGVRGYGRQRDKPKRYVFRRTETSAWSNGRGGYATSIPKRFVQALGLSDLDDCTLIWMLFSDSSIQVTIRRPDGSTVQNEVA